MSDYRVVEEKVHIEDGQIGEDYVESESFTLQKEDEVISVTPTSNRYGEDQYYAIKYLKYVGESQTENSETVEEENKTVEQTETPEPLVQ